MAPRLKNLVGLLGRPFRWIGAREATGKFAGSLVLADALLAGMVVLVLDGYWLGKHLDLESVAILAVGLVSFSLICLAYTDARPRGWPWQAAKIGAANVLALCLFPRAFDYLALHLDRGTFGNVIAVFAPLQLVLHLAHRHYRATAPLEPLRWTLLAVGGLGVTFPFVTCRTIGTGDAYWYGIMVADYVTQLRAGIFPIFVGQSDFAFNGAVSPLRFAPYLQHATGFVDLLTGRTLPFAALLNLVLFSSFLAAAITAYAALVAIERRTRWLALGFALLFVASPGVLSLAYTGDLFMSVCTLPYLPLVMYGIWDTFQRGDTRSVCFLAMALAAVWVCHPPIAFWAIVIATVSQVIRLASSARRADVGRGWLVAATVFVALTGYTFISVRTLGLPVLPAEPTVIIEGLRLAFPAIFQPVSSGASLLSDYQLGWSLWVALFSGAIFALRLRSPNGFALTLMVGSGLLIILLLPIPHLVTWLWVRLMPQAVCNLTYMWPMQRFYVLLGLMAIFLCYSGFAPASTRGSGRQIVLCLVVLAALGWSGIEAVPFLNRGLNNTASEAAGWIARLPQNRVLTRYAFSSFPQTPPYFSHGYVDPLLENRLLAINSLGEIASNHRAVLSDAATIKAQGPVPARHYAPQSAFYELFAALPVEPGRHYALELVIDHPELTGSLIVSGSTIQREYLLPDSSAGMPMIHPATSFGTLPTSGHTISLFSTADQTEPLLLQFISPVPLERELDPFGHYALREFDPKRLPVFVETWAPYRAQVRSPAPAFLETPRIFIVGYHATVNGENAPVSRSPDGLVMFPVPTGESRAQLVYTGPRSLRASYFFSLTAWLVVIGYGLLGRFRRPAVAA